MHQSVRESAMRTRTLFLTYRKLRKIRAISRSGGMNPPSLSLAGRDEALLESATRRNAFLGFKNRKKPGICKSHTISSEFIPVAVKSYSVQILSSRLLNKGRMLLRFSRRITFILFASPISSSLMSATHGVCAVMSTGTLIISIILLSL